MDNDTGLEARRKNGTGNLVLKVALISTLTSKWVHEVKEMPDISENATIPNDKNRCSKISASSWSLVLQSLCPSNESYLYPISPSFCRLFWSEATPNRRGFGVSEGK